MINKQHVQAQIAEYIDPYLAQDLITAKAISDLQVDGSKVTLTLSLGFPAKRYQQELSGRLGKMIQSLPGVETVDIAVDWKVVSHSTQQGVKGLPNVRNIIAVASGKGGVGKSTTSVNLALALAQEGARVGLLDADIYGPNQPQMLGTAEQRPSSDDGKSMEPIHQYGLQTMSIGYLVNDKTPMVWRGPMASGAIQQLLRDTKWDDLDYLLVDMPPGTGDIQLTLAQKVPVAGAVVVTTPQDIALLDVKKAIGMFNKVSIPTLGIIENMAFYECENCGHEARIFGEGGGNRMANEYNVDLLGSLPLQLAIRLGCDEGKPIVRAEPDGCVSGLYREIARKLTASLSLRKRDYSSKFPNIVIEDK